MSGPRDPGLQPERTDLAWRRTAFSAAACSVFLLQAAARDGWGLPVVPGVLVAVVAALAVRASRRGPDRWRRGAGPGRLPPAVGVLITVACLSATALVL